MQQKNYQQWNKPSTEPSEYMMKQLYKQQLDQLMEQKARNREAERQRNLDEKKKFNQMMEYEKQIGLRKQQAYKNYYKLLINQQQMNNQSYISPYYKRDKLKDQHICKMIEDGEKQLQTLETQQKNRKQKIRQNYIAGIRSQLEEKRKLQVQSRERERQEKLKYRRNGLLPGQISRIQRMKHQQQMQKYKQDLDKELGQKSYGKKVQTEESETFRLKHHDPLLNPIPFHIQNPYILKEMQIQKKKQEQQRSKFQYS